MFWVRPEGILLAATFGLKWGLHISPKQRLRAAVEFGLSLVLVIAPLLAFNISVAGSPFPSTILAKFMQWGYPLSLTKTLQYYLDVGLYFLRGPLLLLLPFVVMSIYGVVKEHRAKLAYPLLWMLALIFVQSVMLPRIYHQGRYLMPIIPLVILYGVAGLNRFVSRIERQRLFWLAYRVALIGMTVAL